MEFSGLRAIVIGTLAAGCCYSICKSRRDKLQLVGKTVLITGGSRGLGLAVAEEFAKYGSRVIICARKKEELERGVQLLRNGGAEAHYFICDVAEQEQVNGMISDITATFGPVDVLVNNAGVIKVGPVLNMGRSDFDEALQVMFWGMLNTTFAVLPGMLSQNRGSIVNITSIGGKVAVPHLLPYCCAKFAALAFSNGLAVELAPSGVRVTTMIPGLMRTGSHLNSQFKGRYASEYGWFAAIAATNLISISAERAARAIVRAAIRGERQKVLSLPAFTLDRLHAIAPSLSQEILAAVNNFLPAASQSTESSTPGHVIEATYKSRAWKSFTMPGRLAAASLNESSTI